MLEKNPLSENAQKIVAHKDILKIMTQPTDSKSDFTGVLATMCKKNLKLSKKMAKVHLKGINQ